MNLPNLFKPFNLLKTSPEYTRAGVLWEMRVIAKSNRLQRVNLLNTMYFLYIRHLTFESHTMYVLKF